MSSSGGEGTNPSPAWYLFTPSTCLTRLTIFVLCLQVPLEEGLNKTIQYFSRELEHQANNQYIPKPKAARMKKGRPRHNWGSWSLSSDSADTGQSPQLAPQGLSNTPFSEKHTLGNHDGDDNYDKENETRLAASLACWTDTRKEKDPHRLFRLFALEIPTVVMSLAAHIVLSVFVVYFISFIGGVCVRVCVCGVFSLSRGEEPDWPLGLDCVMGAVPYPRGWPGPAPAAGASLRVHQDVIVFCFVKCQDVHYQSQMLF